MAVDVTSTEHFLATGFDVHWVGPDEDVRNGGAGGGFASPDVHVTL